MPLENCKRFTKCKLHPCHPRSSVIYFLPRFDGRPLFDPDFFDALFFDADFLDGLPLFDADFLDADFLDADFLDADPLPFDAAFFAGLPLFAAPFLAASFLAALFLDPPLDPRLDAPFPLEGTFSPRSLASDNPIAIACLRDLTFLPLRPLFNCPRFISCMVSSTFLPAPFEYLAIKNFKWINKNNNR